MATRKKMGLIGVIAIMMFSLFGGGNAFAQDNTYNNCQIQVSGDRARAICPGPDGSEVVINLGVTDGQVDNGGKQPPIDTGGNTNCGLDKVSTINEVDAAGPQRIEVGGGGTQHVDYYPDRGVPAMSFVVGPQEPVIWWGFGSIWEGQCDAGSFDYLADAAGYARGSDWQPGRLNNGHSGLVMDTRDCTPYDTLWNSFDEKSQALRRQFIDDLLATQRASQDTVLCGDLTSADVQSYDVEGAAPVNNTGTAGCTGQTEPPFVSDFANKAIWTISTGDRIAVVSFWSNWTDPNFEEVKFKLDANQTEKLKGGGDVTYWPTGCETERDYGFDVTNHYPAMTLQEIPARYKAR